MLITSCGRKVVGRLSALISQGQLLLTPRIMAEQDKKNTPAKLTSTPQAKSTTPRPVHASLAKVKSQTPVINTKPVSPQQTPKQTTASKAPSSVDKRSSQVKVVSSPRLIQSPLSRAKPSTPVNRAKPSTPAKNRKSVSSPNLAHVRKTPSSGTPAAVSVTKSPGISKISTPVHTKPLTPLRKNNDTKLSSGKPSPALGKGKKSEKRQPSSDMVAFRAQLDKAKHIVVLTGAGVSAESGVPTFRGAGGFWRKWQAQHLASPVAFDDNPSLVWEFYHYRREVMSTKSPNKAHIAIAACERRLAPQGRRVVVVTQNIDELHMRAGSENIIELHGNLFTTSCTVCGDVSKNHDSPICEALKDSGSPNPETPDAKIPEEQLPRCKKADCGGLLRPNVIWFGEPLDPIVMMRAHEELDKCDLCLVVGTSSVVYPAAMFAPSVASRGVPVAEFNLETTEVTSGFGFHFSGPAGSFLPEALAPTESEPQ